MVLIIIPDGFYPEKIKILLREYEGLMVLWIGFEGKIEGDVVAVLFILEEGWEISPKRDLGTRCESRGSHYASSG